MTQEVTPDPKQRLNVKRGFNRLFLVIWILWAGYCLLVFPAQRRIAAGHLNAQMRQTCYEHQLTGPLRDSNRRDCLKLADDLYQTEFNEFSGKSFYLNLDAATRSYSLPRCDLCGLQGNSSSLPLGLAGIRTSLMTDY